MKNKKKKENKGVGFVITDFENEEHNEAKPVMETEGPHGNKLSYEGIPFYCPTCKKPIKSKDDPWGRCPHCGAQH